MTTLILFYIFAAVMIWGAIMVITSRHPVRAVLSLVMTFVAAAAVWMLMQVEFLSLALIVVYVGAVMVLFLFVVMMINVDLDALKSGVVRYWPLAIVVGLLVIMMLVGLMGPTHYGLKIVAPPAAHAADYSNIKALGMQLYTHFLYPFELAAMILLAAMIVAITLTFRGRRPGVKGLSPNAQIKADAAQRVRLVDLKKGGRS